MLCSKKLRRISACGTSAARLCTNCGTSRGSNIFFVQIKNSATLLNLKVFIDLINLRIPKLHRLKFAKIVGHILARQGPNHLHLHSPSFAHTCASCLLDDCDLENL